MKKYFLLSVITAFTFVFSSCSKDKDGVLGANEDSIIGSWNLTALEATDGKSNTDFDGTLIPATFDAIGKDFDTVVIFSKEPQIVTSEGSYITVLTTTIMSEIENQEQKGEDFFEPNEWNLDGNTLYFGSGEEEVGFTITELTDSKISLRYNLNETVEALGGTTTVSATYNMTLTK